MVYNFKRFNYYKNVVFSISICRGIKILFLWKCFFHKVVGVGFLSDCLELFLKYNVLYYFLLMYYINVCIYIFALISEKLQ